MKKVFSLTSLKVCQSLLCVQFAIHIDEATFSLCDDKLLLPQSTCSHERSTEEARILTKLMGFHGYVNCVFLSDTTCMLYWSMDSCRSWAGEERLITKRDFYASSLVLWMLDQGDVSLLEGGSWSTDSLWLKRIIPELIRLMQ